MANAILSFANLADASTLSASTQAGDLAPANLGTRIIQRVWRSTSGSAWCQADLGSNQDIGLVALAIPRSGLMLGAADTIRLQLDADGGTPGTGAVYDSTALASGVVAAFGYWLHFFETPLSARYVRLTFATSNAYIQAGRLWVGDYFQPAINFSFGWGRAWGDSGTLSAAPKSGIRFPGFGQKARQVSLQFGALDSDEADTLEDGLARVGTTGQLLLCTDPESPPRMTLIGKVAQVSPIQQPFFSLYSHSLAVQEDL